MIYHDVAVSAIESVELKHAREWLLTYNRGDVEATYEIRNWLERDGQTVPSISILDAQFADEEVLS
jgi:hypothetical protein